MNVSLIEIFNDPKSNCFLHPWCAEYSISIERLDFFFFFFLGLLKTVVLNWKFLCRWDLYWCDWLSSWSSIDRCSIWETDYWVKECFFIYYWLSVYLHWIEMINYNSISLSCNQINNLIFLFPIAQLLQLYFGFFDGFKFKLIDMTVWLCAFLYSSVCKKNRDILGFS